LLFLEVQEGKKSASLINADVCPGCAKCIPACNFGAIRMKKLIAQKEKAPEGASVAL
jgi:Fe-S-cluster-containing hydrogenase component 2